MGMYILRWAPCSITLPLGVEPEITNYSLICPVPLLLSYTVIVIKGLDSA
jgi:hypothetical protein